MPDEALDEVGGGAEVPPPAGVPGQTEAPQQQAVHPVDAANIVATEPGQPSGQWSLSGVADVNVAQKRMQDFLRTHAMAGRSFDEAKGNWDIAFPGVPLKEDEYKAWQDRGGQERLLDHVRFQAAQDRPTISGVNLALGPVGADLAKGVMYGNAQQRFNEGTATGEDYGVIAHYENEQRIRAEHASTTGGKLNTLALELPGHLAALLGGGKVAQLVTPASLAAAPGLAAGAARLGIEAIANPAMTPQMWVQRNVAEGKDPFDITGLPPAAAVATLQAGVYKASSVIGGMLGSKVAPQAGEVAKAIGAGVSGPVTQAIADGATYLSGLDSRYGTFQDFMEGRYGDMWQGIVKDALMNGILHAAHGGQPDDVRSSLDDVKAQLDALAKKGYSRERAAKELLAEQAKPTPEVTPGPQKEANAQPLAQDEPGSVPGSEATQTPTEAVQEAGRAKNGGNPPDLAFPTGTEELQAGKPERPEYAADVLKGFKPGKPGLETVEAPVMFMGKEMNQGRKVVYRGPDGEPVAAATLEGDGKGGMAVRDFVTDKTKGLLAGKAAVEVGRELVRMGVTKAIGTTSPDAANLFNKALSKFGKAPEPAGDANDISKSSVQRGTVDPGDLRATIREAMDRLHAELNTKLVPIHAVREYVREKLGDGAASHEAFDEAVMAVRRAKEYRAISISDRSKATEEQLRGSVRGVGETFFYLEHSGKAAEKSAEKAPAPSSAEDVAKVAVVAARRLKATIGGSDYDPAKKYETHKVMFEDVWREAKGELGGMSLEQFKAKLKEAWQAGKLNLSRIDMPQFVKDNEHGSGYDRDKRSEIEHLNATFHSLAANDEKSNALVPPGETAAKAPPPAAKPPAKPAEPPPAPAEPPDSTSIKNAVTEQERARLKMPPPLAADPVGHSYPELADKARAAVERNPERVDALVDELAKKPRPLTDEEDAQILTRHVQLSNQYDQASAALDEARQSGSALDQEAAQRDVNQLWDKKLKFYDAMKAAGTANARGLAARRMMMARDFTLDRMQMVARQAIGGADADPEQLKSLMEDTAKANARIAELEKQLADVGRSHRIERIEAANGSYEDQVRDLTAELLDQDKATHGEIQAAVKLARDKLKDVVTQRPDNPTLEQLAKVDSRGRYHLDLSNPANLKRFVGDRDHDSVPGWDDIVRQVQDAHPDVLSEESKSSVGDTAESKLYDLVTRSHRPMTRTEAKAEAVRRLAESHGDLFAEDAPQKPTRSARTSAARQEVDDAWNDLKKLTAGKLFSNPVDPELLLATAKLAKAYVKLGVNKVADFIARVAERIGHDPTEEEAKVLTAAWDQHTQSVARDRQQKLVERLKDRVDNPEAVSRAAKQLHREAALAGVDGRDERVKWVQQRLAEAIPDITEGATADAIAGYGIYKPLSKDALDAQLRDERGQLQQLGKLRDLEAGMAPKKTGVEQREPSAEERALIQKVNDRRKELGIQTSDPETQLKSALESSKTRMRNQIEDLADQLAKGQQRERPKVKGQEDEALATLRTVRDALKEDYNAMFGERGRTMTDEQKAGMAEKAVERQIAEYQRQIDEKDFARKRGRRVDTEALDALRERRDALKAERDTLRDADAEYQRAKADKARGDESRRLKEKIAELQDRIAKGDVAARGKGEEGAPENAALREQRDALNKQLAKMQREANAKPPKSKEEIVNTRLQAEYARKIAELREKTARGDFSLPDKKTPVARTAETLKLQRTLEGEKQAFLRKVEELRKANAPLGEKLATGLATFVRNSVISSPTTMVKIMGASAWRFGTTPVKEVYGRVLAAVFRRIGLGEIVDKAAREGRGFYSKAEAAGWVEGMTTGFRDAWDQVTKGESELDRAFGKKDSKSAWAEFVGRMHSAAKAPAVRAEFARSMVLRMENAQQHGIDITNPENMLAIQLDAFKDSNRARFQQENWLVDAYNRGVGSLEKSDSGLANAAGATLRVLNPVVRVPSNIAGEIANHTIGVGIGAVRVANALRNGLDKLSPQQADAIMRNFKEGSLGVGLLLLGYFNSGQFGGGFSGKRKEDDLEPGSVRVMGVNIPAFALHNPTMEMLQLGADVARVEHQKTKVGERGLGTGMGHALATWGQEIPLIGHLSKTVAGAFNTKPEEQGYVVGEVLKALTVPQAVQWLAKQLDKPVPFGVSSDTTKRSPKTTTQHVMTGIPGLREDVPKAKK